MAKQRTIKAWGIAATKVGRLIGSGQRGQMYIYWDEADAKEAHADFKKIGMTFKVVGCTITY